MSGIPKITFGIIVFNGEPFTRYCLRALYPFAHEIIVVEGAVRNASDIEPLDSTLDTLYRFKADEDPQNKVQIITREGFWTEKDEQSQAYAERATGDYLWQVDIDEFYQPQDMQAILAMLKDSPEITAVSFKQMTFWGGFDYITDSWYLRRGPEIFHRLFKWGVGYRYMSHRPPTVYDPQGRDLRSLKWVNGYELARRHILLYHYALVFPKQVLEKCIYRSKADWAIHSRGARKWYEENFLQLHDPFHVYNDTRFLSWLERFNGEHPPEVIRLKTDIESGLLDTSLRHKDDIEQLLSSKVYCLQRNILDLITPFYLCLRKALSIASRLKQRLKGKKK